MGRNILKYIPQECPCGYYGDSFKQCSCSLSLVSRYQRRGSGLFVDRVNIFVEVPRIDYEKLYDDRSGETSDKVRARVEAARSHQRKRFAGTRLICNSEMTPAEVKGFLQGIRGSPGPIKGNNEAT